MRGFRDRSLFIDWAGGWGEEDFGLNKVKFSTTAPEIRTES